MANEAKIKLSAEGVAQVTNAFRKVQDEARRAGKGGAEGIGVLNNALGGLKKIVGAVAVGALVIQLKQQAMAAIDAADGIGDLATAAGNSTELISLFAGAAKESGVSMDVMTKAVININKNLDALKGGDKQAVELFKRIGLSAKDFAGLNADQALQKVALRLGELEGSAGTVTVATQLMGKKGLEALEVFQKMSDEGIDPLMERMKKAGIIFSQEFTDAADRAKKSLADLQIKTQAATVQFLTGFLPALDGLSDSFSNASDSGSALRETGEIIGVVVVSIGKSIAIVSKAIVGLFALLTDYFIGVKESFIAIATFDFKRLVQAFKNIGRDMANTAKAVGEDIANTWSPAIAPLAAPKAGKGGKKVTGDATNSADLAKSAKAREDFLKAQLDNELKLFQAKRSLQSDDEKRDFENSKTSLQAYFTERYKALSEESKKELDVLQRQRDIIANRANFEAGDAEKKAKDLAEIDEKIALKKIENQAKLNALGQENRVATEALRKDAIGHENDMLALQGQRFAAAKAALEEELKLLDAMLIKQGKTLEERERIKSQFKAQAGASIDFEQQREKAEGALRNLDRAQADIRRKVETGVIGPLEGEQQSVALLQQKLSLLRAEADEYLRLAKLTGNAQNIEQAMQYRDALAEVGVAANKLGRDVAEVRGEVEHAGIGAGADFLNGIITRCKSGSEAVHEFSQSVIASFSAIISKKLSEKLFGSLFGGLGDLGGGILGIFGPSSAKAQGKAEGGKITGPGTGTSDSIPAIGPMGRLFRLSNEEFIVRNAVVKQPGAEAFLQDFNRYGMRTLAIREFSRAPRYAGGGKIGGSASPAAAANYAAPPVVLQVHPDALHMTLSDWFQGELARTAARR